MLLERADIHPWLSLVVKKKSHDYGLLQDDVHWFVIIHHLHSYDSNGVTKDLATCCIFSLLCSPQHQVSPKDSGESTHSSTEHEKVHHAMPYCSQVSTLTYKHFSSNARKPDFTQNSNWKVKNMGLSMRSSFPLLALWLNKFVNSPCYTALNCKIWVYYLMSFQRLTKSHGSVCC